LDGGGDGRLRIVKVNEDEVEISGASVCLEFFNGSMGELLVSAA